VRFDLRDFSTPSGVVNRQQGGHGGVIDVKAGKVEGLKIEKISRRVRKQAIGLSPLVDPEAVVAKVAQGLTNNISTAEIDELVWRISASLTRFHPDYARLAARIWITRLHKIE
jgi:hypothetical protein